MKTLEFLQQVLPEDGYYCAATPKEGGGFKQRFFSSLEDLADFSTLLSDKGGDAYFALASFKEAGSRKGINAHSIKVIALDIDVGKADNSYPSLEEAAVALATFMQNSGMPQPTVVRSGMGFHVYWPLTVAMEPEQWRPLAESVKQLAIQNGLIIDPKVTSDVARVLRVVGTTHTKSGRKVKVLRVGHPVSAGEISQVTGRVTYTPRKTTLLDNLAVKRESPPAVAGIIALKCKQLDWGIRHQREVSEPFWYMMLGAAAYTTDPEGAAIAWSNQHDGFSEAGTLAKLNQWKQNASGPPTCAGIEAARPGGCKGCPYSGKVNTPVRLGVQYEAVAAPESAPDEVSRRVALPPPFKRTVDGIKITIEDADIDVCPFDIYPVGYGKDEGLGYEVVRFHWNRPHVGWTELKLRQAHLTEGHRDFPVVCADQGIVLASKRQTETFQMMLRSYTENLKREQTLTNLYSTMGWKNGHKEFVLGDAIIRKNMDGNISEEKATLASSVNRVGGDIYGTVGTLAEWKNATRLLDTANMPWHSFALSTGFAAPLFAFTGLKGMTISLYGPTGGGKTLIQYWIQSIYGDPDKLHFSAKYTLNSLFSRLGMYAHLPMTIDEATMMPDKDVGDFLYWVSQGRDKARLNRSSEERDAKTWALPVVLSTNKSIQSKLMATGLDTDAQMARLLEINIPQHKLFAKDSTAGQKIYQHLMSNYGTAGRVFLAELVRLGEDGIKQLIAEGRKDFEKKYDAKFSGSERFWEQAVILQDVGAKLASKLGLIDYDYTAGTRWVLEQLGAIRDSVSENRVDAFDLLGEFLNDVAADSITVLHTGKSPPFVVRSARGEIRARFDMYRPNPGSEFVRGNLMIDRAEFRKWLAFRGGDYKAFITDMTQARAINIPPSKRGSLGRGTDTKLTQVHVIGFDLTHDRLKGALTDADEGALEAATSKLKVLQGGAD